MFKATPTPAEIRREIAVMERHPWENPIGGEPSANLVLLRQRLAIVEHIEALEREAKYNDAAVVQAEQTIAKLRQTVTDDELIRLSNQRHELELRAYVIKKKAMTEHVVQLIAAERKKL